MFKEDQIPLREILIRNGDPLQVFVQTPFRVYKAMGPFGRIILLPFWIMFLPLHYLGAVSVVLCFPLWLAFIVALPGFLLVILFEHIVHWVGMNVFSTDIRWVRKKKMYEKWPTSKSRKLQHSLGFTTRSNR